MDNLVEWETKFIACMKLKKTCLDRNYVIVVYDDSYRFAGTSGQHRPMFKHVMIINLLQRLKQEKFLNISVHR